MIGPSRNAAFDPLLWPFTRQPWWILRACISRMIGMPCGSLDSPTRHSYCYLCHFSIGPLCSFGSHLGTGEQVTLRACGRSSSPPSADSGRKDAVLTSVQRCVLSGFLGNLLLVLDMTLDNVIWVLIPHTSYVPSPTVFVFPLFRTPCTLSRPCFVFSPLCLTSLTLSVY